MMKIMNKIFFVVAATTIVPLTCTIVNADVTSKPYTPSDTVNAPSVSSKSTAKTAALETADYSGKANKTMTKEPSKSYIPSTDGDIKQPEIERPKSTHRVVIQPNESNKDGIYRPSEGGEKK